MINNASDYKYVTGLENFLINGQIMPLRSGSAADAIRGEDIAFLAEAQREIIADAMSVVTPVALEKNITYFQASRVLYSSAMTAYNPDASLYAGRFAEVSFSEDTSRYQQDVLDALGLTAVTLPIPQMQYPLIRKDDVDKSFERISLARRVYGGAFLRTNVDWTNRNEGNGWPSGTDIRTTRNTRDYVKFVESYGSRTTTSGSQWKWTQEGRIWAAPRGTAIDYALPEDYNDVWQIWCASAHIQKTHLTGNFDQKKYFALVTPANVDWYALATTYATQILNSFGTWYTDYDAGSDDGAVNIGNFYTKHVLASVSVDEVCRVVDVSDRIRW